MNSLLSDLESTLPVFHHAFRQLERKVPAPEPTKIGDRTYPRYREMTAEQAALQKVARYISGLHALLLLLRHRHLQEDGTIKRTLDELGEDVIFLLIEPTNEKEKILHKRFLDSFYAEEFDAGVSPMESSRKRKRLLRREVLTYIQVRTTPTEPQSTRPSAVIYQGYSGYVHADSPHLMEMWDWKSQRYELNGVKDVDLFESHVADAVNYFVRGLFGLAALASRLAEPQLYTALKSRGDELAGISAVLWV